METAILIPIIGCLSFFGTIITIVVLRMRSSLRMKEMQLEELPLENEARQLAIEEKRLLLVLDDQARGQYNQKPY
jgi:hypothetical protein